MAIFGYILGVIYSILCIYAAVVGRDETSIYATLIMILGSVVTIVGIVLCFNIITIQKVLMVIFGLLLIQVSTIINGYILYHKFNLKHQGIRFLLGLLIVLLIII